LITLNLRISNGFLFKKPPITDLILICNDSFSNYTARVSKMGNLPKSTLEI
jgi:hypothetical protein